MTGRNPHRASPYLSVFGDESCKKVLVLSGSFSLLHWNANDFVTAAMVTVPGPMFGRESIPVILGRNRGFSCRIESHFQRCHVRLNQHIGGDDFGFELRMGTDQSRILMSAHVIPGPTVKSSFPHGSYIVWDKVVSEPVAFIGRTPELARDWVDRLAHAVAKPIGIHFNKLAFRGKFEHISPVKFIRMGIRIVYVRSTSDRNQQVFAIGGEDDIPGPVPAPTKLSITG